jgi:2-amino-4-hydroxy-6-hydroxymethyldihydropteridine diphosphokinase
MIYILALGSNLGNRFSHLFKAIEALKQKGEIQKQSKIYLTKPEDMLEPGLDFLNMAVQFNTAVTPLQMLRIIKKIESESGRDLSLSHNLPRTIDIDIIFSQSQIIREPELIIPHPMMHQRSFVLIPLQEISPGFIHPVFSKSVNTLLESLIKEKPILQKSISVYEKQF